MSLALAYAAYRQSPRPEAHASVIEAVMSLRSSGLKGVISDHGELFYSEAFSNDSRPSP